VPCRDDAINEASAVRKPTGSFTQPPPGITPPEPSAQAAVLAAITCEEAFMPGCLTDQPRQLECDRREIPGGARRRIAQRILEIFDAGLILQIDDPQLASHWTPHPEIDLAQCHKWARASDEVLNLALRGISVERVRYHTCYSINMGPRVHDMELQHIVDIMLGVQAGAYSFEAGNPPHEHDWRVCETVKLPEGKLLIPGIITHDSNLVEHTEAVAQRIGRFATVVGRENVIADADCGFASFSTSCEVHPSVVWTKLAALAEGPCLATKELWGEARWGATHSASNDWCRIGLL
jgi:hypothetical protein